MLRCLFLSAALLVTGVPAASATDEAGEEARAVVTAAIDGFIRPAYRRLHDDTGLLRQAMGTLCGAADPAALAAAQGRFLAAVRDWSAVEIVRLGPVSRENRLERILYWPDRKGIGLRQVQALLAEKDEVLTDPSALAAKSVAVQGLTALEFVLYGTGAEELTAAKGSFRCRYGLAVAGNLDGVAGEIAAGWDDAGGFAATWTSPGPSNRLYRDDAEMLGALVDQLVYGIDLVRDVRLHGFLGATAAEDHPTRALLRRSGATLASIDANMDGMRRLFEASGIGRLLGPDDDWIPESVGFEFGNAHETLAAVTLPLEAALADEKERKILDHMNLVLRSLTNLVAGKLGQALGLTTGFSSLDGD